MITVLRDACELAEFTAGVARSPRSPHCVSPDSQSFVILTDGANPKR
jgi:hypothetical protein